MCGFFGILRSGDQPIDLGWVRAATTAMRHRGPDDEGYLLVNFRENQYLSCGGPDTDPQLSLPNILDFTGQDFDLALGFRRLSIIDLTPKGHQPMTDWTGSSWIVFNGQIYNYLELRKQLEQSGYRFRSTSDTEVLLAAYRCWGTDALQRLTGMFGFAILDVPSQQLFLARDCFGIKPLYYTTVPGWFAFASEIKGLLQVPFVQRTVQPQALYNYLKYGWTDTGELTMFQNIAHLPAAHSMAISLEKRAPSRPVRYWQIDLQSRYEGTLATAAGELRELFFEAVNLHMRSDVPVGVALSGGIDSSAIAVAMGKISDREQDLHAFGFLADDPVLNEEPWIDMAGAEAGVILHKVTPQPEDLTRDLDALVYAQEEPFVSTSMYAQYRIYRLVQETGIKVTLDGQGADEMLAGYFPFIAMRLASLVRQGKYGKAVGLLKSSRRLERIPLSQIILGLLDQVVPGSLRGIGRKATGKDTTPPWMNSGWFRERNAYPHPPFVIASQNVLRESLHRSLTENSLPLLLRYEDRNSMAHSVESRVPFLTPKLAQFVFSLPEDFLIRPDGTTKAVFRAAMAGIVPQPILDRKDKIGFVPPERAWLVNQRTWVEQQIHSETAGSIPAVVPKLMRQHWEQLQRDPRTSTGALWRWINLIRWVDCFSIQFSS